MMSLSSSAQRVQEALSDMGLTMQVIELPDSTRTAVEAASAIDCTVGQIAKSLIFKTMGTEKPVLVIASGANRVDEKKVAAVLGEKITIADADFVRQHTGFAIGGVPPVGHIEELLTLIDEDLRAFNEIWAAAGTPHAVFRLTGNELVRVTQGQVVKVS